MILALDRDSKSIFSYKTKKEEEDSTSFSENVKDEVDNYGRNKIADKVGEFSGDRLGNVFEAKYDAHTENVALKAYKEHVSWKPTGGFEKGSNSTAGQAARVAVEESVFRNEIRNVGSGIVRGSASTSVGIAVSATIELAVDPDHSSGHVKKVIGKNVTTGIVTAVVMGTGVAAAATAAVAAVAAGIGLAPIIASIAATAVITIAVGAAVSTINNVLRNNIPAVADFEDAIGSGIVDGYDATKKFVGSTYKKAVKAIGSGARLATRVGSAVASVGKVLVDDAMAGEAITALRAAKGPLQKIKKENSQIMKEMADSLNKLRYEAAALPLIKMSDVDEVIAKHRLSVKNTVDEHAIRTVNDQIDDQLEDIERLISGIRNAVTSAQSQDRAWAGKFGI